MGYMEEYTPPSRSCKMRLLDFCQSTRGPDSPLGCPVSVVGGAGDFTDQAGVWPVSLFGSELWSGGELRWAIDQTDDIPTSLERQHLV